ncbi:MAG TPA: DUF4242 domain-containing protein [Candidatus Acidoferrales bacterium]|nr:DUF4242 domain-containing protein [Candidatus Acidoferrales bacterium]
MPRYIVERTFQDGLTVSLDESGARVCTDVVNANAKHGVTWVHSYVSGDRRKTYCVYDGPSAEAIRAAAHDTNLPIDSITEVGVLDPYFYRSGG